MSDDRTAPVLHEEDVRRIVREELAEYEARKKEQAEISASMAKVNIEHQLEAVMADMPEDVRDKMRAMMKGMFGQ